MGMMIARLKGRLEAKGKDHAIIDVSGISFKVLRASLTP